jgi:hypothetical protein
MGAKFSDLISYFEKLAAEHVSIKHTASDKHFYRFELDEVLTGMCANLKYPALILEGYDFQYQESNSDNIRKRRSGAFILIDKASDRKDFNRIHDIWDFMEEIGNDILIRMRTDKESHAEPVMSDFAIEECEGVPLSITELGQHGIRFTFSIISPVSNEVDKDKWQ